MKDEEKLYASVVTKVRDIQSCGLLFLLQHKFSTKSDPACHWTMCGDDSACHNHLVGGGQDDC